MVRRGAFTLIEVLVSTALLSLVLLGLYKSLDLQRDSNKQLHTFLQKTLQHDRVAMTLYRDLLSSNGDITVHQGEFDRICIHRTSHSLYALPVAKVCWLVAREGRYLTRIEGGDYRLPLKDGDRVAIDRILPRTTLFDIYRKEGDILVDFEAEDHAPAAFLFQGLDAPPKRKPSSKAKPQNQTRETTPGQPTHKE
jgi:prepilin-type N-terminal cleavage/methylation domain-containing protein